MFILPFTIYHFTIYFSPLFSESLQKDDLPLKHKIFSAFYTAT